MRRKSGELITIELDILEAAVRLCLQGNDEFHGFQIAKKIKVDKEETRNLTSHGTLYRALDRLHKAGYLSSHWEDPLIAAEQNRPRRKFYKLTGLEASIPVELAKDSTPMIWAIGRSPA